MEAWSQYLGGSHWKIVSYRESCAGESLTTVTCRLGWPRFTFRESFVGGIFVSIRRWLALPMLELWGVICRWDLGYSTPTWLASTRNRLPGVSRAVVLA